MTTYEKQRIIYEKQKASNRSDSNNPTIIVYIVLILIIGGFLYFKTDSNNQNLETYYEGEVTGIDSKTNAIWTGVYYIYNWTYYVQINGILKLQVDSKTYDVLIIGEYICLCDHNTNSVFNIVSNETVCQ